MAKPPPISSVFTPRNADVNLKMYVPRLDLENALLRSVHGTMHSLLFGDSGTGKSWLYKKVLDQNNIPYTTANCANASRFKSLTEEIFSALIPAGTSQKTGYTENKEATIKALVADGRLSHQNQYSVSVKEPLQEAFSAFRKRAGSDIAVLVIDNLESIFKSEALMDELADIIILLDDSRYSVFNIKLLIVGIPNGTLEYFSKTKNMESVANRIEELPKVAGMTLPQVTTLVSHGFKLLEIPIPESELPFVSGHIYDITLGVPQRVHEYCEKLAYAVSDQSIGFNGDCLKMADREWTRVGLRQAYTVMESHLNSKRTAIARRNQVIFAIGKIKTHQFDSGTIAEKVRELFPTTSTGTGMGISNILGDLAIGESPLLSKNVKTNSYRVIDPRYVMCIRVALYLNPETKTVEKRMFAN